MWNGEYFFVEHGVAVAAFKILSLLAYFFCFYHPYILLISLEISFVLLVCVLSFFGSVTDNTACIHSKLELNCF